MDWFIILILFGTDSRIFGIAIRHEFINMRDWSFSVRLLICLLWAFVVEFVGDISRLFWKFDPDRKHCLVVENRDRPNNCLVYFKVLLPTAIYRIGFMYGRRGIHIY